jgi:RNA polymerase sigma factor (sigma-70 family)
MDFLGIYLRRIQKRLLRGGRSREDAEDIVQEAYLRMQAYCERGGKVQEPQEFLLQTATRLAINARRDSHQDLYSKRRVEDLTFIVDSSPLPEEVLAADECLLKMRATLDALGRSTREIFFMHRLDGMSYAQIAKVMGLSVSTVEKRIANAVTTLARAMSTEEKG